jgi:hypothetical protein
MYPDQKTVEQLVRIITREVLIAMAEQQQATARRASSANSTALRGCASAPASTRSGR